MFVLRVQATPISRVLKERRICIFDKHLQLVAEFGLLLGIAMTSLRIAPKNVKVGSLRCI